MDKNGKIIHIFKSKRRVNRSRGGDVFIFIVLGIAGLFTAFPLYLAIINSLKPLNELFLFPPRLYVLNPTLKNFADLLVMMSSSTVPFMRYIFNTFFITIAGTLGQVVFASMCAYPLAKHNVPGGKIYFKIIVLSLMFSSSVTAIPNYLIMSRIGWIDTYFAVIVPVFGSTLGLYLMKQFMEQISDSLLEAAKIDGASEWRIFWQIVMPQVKPAWLTLTIFSVQGLWGIAELNTIYTESLKTFAYALGQIISAGIARAGVGASIAVVMMSVPIIVFIITQSNVIETMSNSGIKE
ncbi:MAG: carbohydrate ABC transporter permease [Saccharofermentanales bacterium]